MIKKVDLEAEDIVLELTDKMNQMIDSYNRLEEQGVFIVPKAPTPEGKALEKAVEKTAEKEDTDPIILRPHLG